MDDIVLRVCGEVRLCNVTADDHTVRGLGGALLTLLGLRPGTAIPIDSLADELWNGDPPQTARAALRNVVTRLRRDIAEYGAGQLELTTTSTGYSLDIDADRVDLHRLERLVNEGRRLERGQQFSELLGLVREGSDLIDGVPFATVDLDVVIPPGARAASLLREHEARAARTEYQAGDLATAERLAHDHLINDPCDESALEVLMRSLYRQGRATEALDACAALAGQLAERGMELSPQLRELEGLVLRHDQTLTAPTPAVSGNRPMFDLIGRESEWANSLRVTTDGHGALAILGGAGSGKSRLVGELRDYWRRTGVPLASIECARDCLPFEPWRGLLEQLGVRDDVFARSSDPAVSFASVLDELASSAQQHRARYMRPMMLIIDDCHWLDDDSVSLLSRVIASAESSGLMLVLSSRTSAADLRSPFAGVLSDFLRLENTHHIELGPLRSENAHKLVAAVAEHRGLRLDETTIGQICERAAGIPLYLMELASVDTGPTATLRVSVLDRLRALGSETETLLRALAVLGRVVDPDHLSAAAELPRAAVDRLLAAAQRSGLVRVETSSGVIEFAHDLITEIVVSDTTELEQARIHQSMVGVLSDDQLTTFGLAHIEGAVPLLPPQRAAELLVKAARVAIGSSALAAGAQLAERALSVVEQRCPERIDLLTDALIVAGEAVTATDEARGRELLARAADLAFTLGDPVRLTEAVDTRRGRNFVIDPVTINRLRQALDWVPERQRELRSRIEAELALMTVEVYPGITATEHGRAALHLADRCRNTGVLTGALHARILSSRVDLEPSQRLGLSRRLRDLGVASKDNRSMLLADMLRLVDELELGQARVALADAAATETEADRIGWWRYRFYSIVIQAAAMEAIGNSAGFAAASQRAVAIGSEAALADASMIGAAQRVVALIHSDQLGDALPMIEPVIERYGSLPVWNCVFAAALAHAGHSREADAVLRRIHADTNDPFPRGLMYWTCHSLVALASHWAGLPRWGEAAHEQLVPAANRFIVPGFGLGVLGPAEIFIALAASAAGDERASSEWADRASTAVAAAELPNLKRFVTSMSNERRTEHES